MVNWLAETTTPLFLSDVRLRGRKKLPTAAGQWALDSGAFSQLLTVGAWPHDAATRYVERIQRYCREIGTPDWIAPQDWMCEPFMIQRTGLTIEEHQKRTVYNYCLLHSLDETLPFIPVLQGFSCADYYCCVEEYSRNGVNLATMPVIGLGSVCRRQGTQEVASIIGNLAHDFPQKLHGFGVKITGLAAYGHLIQSADSMAWSFDARRKPRMVGHSHKNCANCLPFAEAWYQRVTTTTVTQSSPYTSLSTSSRSAG